MQVHVNLPTKPENIYDYVQPLAPKHYGKFNHEKQGKNTMYISFFNNMKRDFKSKRVIGDDKKWCTACKAHGHLVNEWKCPKNNKDVPKSHKSEFMAFCNEVSNAWQLPAAVETEISIALISNHIISLQKYTYYY